MSHISKPRTSKKCNEYKLTPLQNLLSILSILGLSLILAFILMIGIFFGERIDMSPFWGIFYIDGLSEGENWILFVGSIIFSLFIGLLFIWLIYRYFRLKNCSDLNEIEQIDRI